MKAEKVLELLVNYIENRIEIVRHEGSYGDDEIIENLNYVLNKIKELQEKENE